MPHPPPLALCASLGAALLLAAVLVPGAVVAGQVLDAAGTPLEGAWVRVAPLRAARTDAAGRYRIGVLRGTGRGAVLTLTARHAGHEPARRTVLAGRDTVRADLVLRQLTPPNATLALPTAIPTDQED
jgi:hypothetical protein